MKLKHLEEKIEIPQGVSVLLDKRTIIIKGPKGEIKRENSGPIDIKIDKDIIISSDDLSFREKALFYTLKAHLKNMIKGAVEGYTVKMKICSGHFPMSVNISGKDIIIKNFLGEKVSRNAKIEGESKVKIEGDSIVITGCNKENVGQTASNLETSTKVSNRDRRVFQDGIYRLK